jgi:hypothetical protein
VRPVPVLASFPVGVAWLAVVAGLAVVTLVLGGCSTTTGPTMTVTGRIELGPMCPVEREGSPCAVPPEAFAGAEAVARQGDVEVRAPVAADGTFALSLADGWWEVTATAGMSCSPVTVRTAGPVVIACDTGIR